MAYLLVIDDDESYRDYLTTLLVRSGHTVRGLAHGKRLQRILESERFDAVITDLYMPEIDGIEILLVIRKVAPAMPVIGITGGYVPTSRAMMALGADAVIEKPIDVANLCAVLHAVLKKPVPMRPSKPEGNDA
jgi:DNA-binding NtrC family response regulator